MEDLVSKLKEKNIVSDDAEPLESFSDAFKTLSNVFILLKKNNGYLIDDFSFSTRIDYSVKKYRCSINVSGDQFTSLASTQEKAFSILALKIYNHYLD
ncbi:MAG: hypothetical protein CL670_01800 [Balneola sp.]|jgi:hypothetical protein|nr:hypothetical protein [Balneola sp.]MBE77869.1 hypothetical protein [Balneola sp.]HBX64647.1 hypothetical protein [Balneolaceae bacterium]|tara:strand:- start:425 stop:718 length:294 start_codon:yes stop_codon:yes gene_type:complete